MLMGELKGFGVAGFWVGGLRVSGFQGFVRIVGDLGRGLMFWCWQGLRGFMVEGTGCRGSVVSCSGQ